MLIRFENHSTCSILLLSAWVVRSVIEIPIVQLPVRQQAILVLAECVV